MIVTRDARASGGGSTCLGIGKMNRQVTKKNLVNYLFILSSQDCMSQGRFSALAEFLATGPY